MRAEFRVPRRPMLNCSIIYNNFSKFKIWQNNSCKISKGSINQFNFSALSNIVGPTTL